MPLRRDGDRIEEIESFDTWVQDRLEEAIARGEFENLPLKGKPINIESNPFQPELDLAFSRLKNAGMAPAWIELDREIRRMQDALADWLQATADRLAAEAARIQALTEETEAVVEPEVRPWYQRWWPFRLFADAGEVDEQDPDTEWRRWSWQRGNAREQYLERAAQLDARIALFNSSVPRPLWHLEKLRFLPKKAQNRFDSTIPPRSGHARADLGNLRFK